MAKSLCRGCGETFKSGSGFDLHRVGGFGDPIYATTSTGNRGKITGYTPVTRRCLTVEEMLAKGLTRNEKVWWVTKAYDESAHEEEEEANA